MAESFGDYFSRTRGNNAAANQADDWKLSDLGSVFGKVNEWARKKAGSAGVAQYNRKNSSSGSSRSHRGGAIPQKPLTRKRSAPMPKQAPAGYEQFQGGSAPSLADYLSGMGNVEGMFGSEIQGFGNQRADLQNRRAEAMQEIARAYTGVGQQMTEARDNSDAGYAAAQQAQTQNNEAAQGAINHAVTQGQESVANIAQNLGLEDAVDNTASERDRAFYAARAAEQGQGQGAQLSSNRASALNFNNVNIGASGQRSAETQSAAGRDYDSALAALADQETQFRSQAQSELRNLAMQKYQADASRFSDDRNFQYQEWLRNQQWNREDAQNAMQWDLDQQKAMADGMVTTGADTLRQRLRQEGVSDPKISEWLLRGQKNAGNKNMNMGTFMQQFGGSAGSNAALQEYFQEQGYFRK